MARNPNYSGDRETEENFNYNGKYSETGESEFSRDMTIPFDEDEVLTERHYTFAPLEQIGRRRIRAREYKSEPSTPGFRGRGPRGYRRTDETIKEDVSEALYRNWDVDATDIEVKVSDGTMTLKGWVETREQKRKAESAIENLLGVENVYNELHVRIKENPKPGRFGLTDNITGLN